MERIGDARVVLLGEATHGTSEFYRLRARITQALVEQKSFDVVAVEADWPDAARIDHYVRDRDVPVQEWRAFSRFPTWMWRNEEMADFVEWLRGHNESLERKRRVRFAGLDLYSLDSSISEVLGFLEERDPRTAQIARERYGCLTPWQSDPAAYGRAALSGSYRSCEREVVGMLGTLLRERTRLANGSDEHLFDAVQNARLVADAESYYRIMYYGSHESWNLRDRHMFETPEMLLRFGGPQSKVVIWEHNSHVGDARATEMSARGELNVGELCRELSQARLERAIGVIYRPETERASHYFQAVLPRQFDEYVWVDQSEAVRPLDAKKLVGVPDTYPFGL